MFKNIDDVVATTKAAKLVCHHKAGLPSPPVPMITQWATWLRATIYYSENLPAVCTIVNIWTGEGLLVSRAQEAINVDGLVRDLIWINQYRTLATNVELLQASDCTMIEAYELLKKYAFSGETPAQFSLHQKTTIQL